MKIFSLIMAVCLAVGAVASAEEPLEKLGVYRWIEKGTRYSYIGNFPTYRMVESRAELDSVRIATDANTPSMIKSSAAAQFDSIFNQPKFNFDEESLALICLRQTSGGNQVTTGIPTYDGDTLYIPIEVIIPPFGTADMAYYVYALAVNKSLVKAVRLQTKSKRWAPPMKN